MILCLRGLPYAVKETTWVHKIFGGRLRSRVTCRSCGHPSDTFDSLLDLSIDVPKRASIREALDAFVAIDVLAGADKYKCEKCKKPVVAEKQFTIHEAPQVLTIHLKRFTPLGRKMTHLVRYDERLSLQKYMSAGQVRHSPVSYYLRCQGCPLVRAPLCSVCGYLPFWFRSELGALHCPREGQEWAVV